MRMMIEHGADPKCRVDCSCGNPRCKWHLVPLLEYAYMAENHDAVRVLAPYYSQAERQQARFRVVQLANTKRRQERRRLAPPAYNTRSKTA